MNLSIDKASTEPIYEQIRRQVEDLVRQGLLTSGTRIPSVRELAGRLGVTKNTVSVAYDELAARRLIESRRGSGTYITSETEVATGVNLHRRQEMVAELAEFPPMRWEPYFFRSEFFGMPLGPQTDGLIRFTQAAPDPALFPFERIKQVATNLLWTPQEHFFDIGHVQGYQPLVEHLEREMALAGVPMAEGQNDIILTNGFRRSLGLILDFIVQPGQTVAIEAPSYPNLLNFLISKRIGYVPVPMDGEGMDTEFLAGALQRGEVQAVITIPTFHNPTGITMSPARREHLLRLAMQHRVPIIEDDWGRHLRYEGPETQPMKALDHGGYVIHIGTFSKCLMPGLKVSWITCPAGLSVELLRSKLGSEGGDSYFLQSLLMEFISKGHFDRHLRKTCREYKQRRDAMCDTLARCLPAGCRYRVPQGGFSVWLELPAEIPSVPLLGLARQAGVDFAPGAFMMPDRRDTSALRLSFSRQDRDSNERGCRILCGVIADVMRNPDKLDEGYRSYKDLYR